jgi:hypothetical protein
MSNPIVGLVERELARFKEFHKAHPLLFPKQDNLYPVPFFGDIRIAEVLTLALNPAWTEFRQGGCHERYWIPSLNACALTTRLLHYFDLPVPPPHRWFEERRVGLDCLRCSYKTNVAHIDLHPFPTKFSNAIGEDQRKEIGHLIQSESKMHLSGALKLARKVKLILVVDYTFLLRNGTPTKTFDFVASRYSGLLGFISGQGSRPPIFRVGEPDQFEARIRQCAEVLLEHLRNSSVLKF